MATPDIKVSIADLKDATVAALIEATNGLIEGARGDVQNFLHAIVADALEAGVTGDKEVLAQLDDQRLVLMEINRIRVVEGYAEVLRKVLAAGINVALKLLVPIPTGDIGGALMGGQI